MLFVKLQDPLTFSSREEDFMRFLPYTGVVAIWFM